MNEIEKQQYIGIQCDLIKGCMVTDLDVKRQGNMVFLTTIHLKHPNGNEFVIRPFDWQQLHVIQTLWGSN